jgi:hypothetical protein
MIDRMSRRSALLGLAVGCGGLVSGCVAPPEPTPAPLAEPPPLPVLASLAAQVGVEVADPGTRQVVLRTASGGQMNVTLAAGTAMPRAGSRVLFQYDDRGAARVLPVPRRPGAVPPGMIAATIREVERGGRHMALVDAAGIEAAFALPHPAMMAFATRLAPGEAVAVSVAGP